MKWMRFVPALLAALVTTAATAECEKQFLEANAIFIRATTHCKRNYMDSPVGYYALAMSRQCKDLKEEELMTIAKSAMQRLDKIADERGKPGACKWVDDLEKAIRKDIVGR
jgi:hypothetical protein